MAGQLNTLSRRVVLVVLAIHAVLMPLLYFGVMAVVGNSLKDASIDNMRIYGRVFADSLESYDIYEDEPGIIDQLDHALLGGWVVFATLERTDRTSVGTLMSAEELSAYAEDFSFGEHDDAVYYLSIPINHDPGSSLLRLGFDEVPTLRQIDGIRRSILFSLFAYLVFSIALAVGFATALVLPLRDLQRVSRQVSSGDYQRELRTDSSIVEIDSLAHDLELMRSKLVGINARLEQVIKEREEGEARQKLLEDRLRHSQRLESIGTLAGGIAHEFNNVLAPIVLYTDLALEDLPDDSGCRANLERVITLADRAKGLSKQILTFGRETGEAEKVSVDLAPIVEESISLVRALVPATVDIQADIQHNLGFVLCDTAQIQQLVINLCSNAFRSLSKGGGQISVAVDSSEVDESMAATHPGLYAGLYVVLSVKDTGKGMDKATMERIFEPFFTTQQIGQGTGLGLSVVHGIVAKHWGDIIVSSAPGSGSTFRVYLPLAGRQNRDDKQEGEHEENNSN